MSLNGPGACRAAFRQTPPSHAERVSQSRTDPRPRRTSRAQVDALLQRWKERSPVPAPGISPGNQAPTAEPDAQGPQTPGSTTSSLSRSHSPGNAGVSSAPIGAPRGRPRRASDQARRRRLLPREAAARLSIGVVRARSSVAWIAVVSPSLLPLHGCRSGRASDRALPDAWTLSDPHSCCDSRGALATPGGIGSVCVEPILPS